MLYLNVIDDGGFTYGMDDRTPVSWRVTRRPLKRAYRSCGVPVYMDAWARGRLSSKETIVASLRDLLALAQTLRP